MPDLNVSTKCMALAAINLRAIDSTPGLRIVILAMSWDPPSTTPAGEVPNGSESRYLLASLDRLIEDLKQHGKTVVLVGPLATPETEAASIAARQLAFRGRIDEPTFLPESTFMAQNGDIIDHFVSRDDIVFIRPDRIQCQLGRCDYFRDGQSFFADYSHLTMSALPFFRPVFESGLRKAILRDDQSRN
jgi:hypothetical protein